MYYQKIINNNLMSHEFMYRLTKFNLKSMCVRARVSVLENETMDGPNPSQFIRIKPKMEERR